VAGEQWGENEKDWVELGGAGRLLVFSYPVKGIWLIIKVSP